MTNVIALRESDWKKDDGTTVKVTHLTLEDGREIPGYDLPPGAEAGKPLPDGWEVATSKSGKPYMKAPKPGKGGFGGASAFRNTKEGQAIEQERMDRRTALMQGVAAIGAPDIDLTLTVADQFYVWLRATAGAAGASTPPSPHPAPGGPLRSVTPGASTSAAGEAAEEPQRGGGGLGKAPASSCTHQNTSPLGPTGRAVPAGKLFCLDCRTVIREP